MMTAKEKKAAAIERARKYLARAGASAPPIQQPLALRRHLICKACEHVVGMRCTIQFPDAAHCRCRQWLAGSGSRCPINKWGPEEVNK